MKKQTWFKVLVFALGIMLWGCGPAAKQGVRDDGPPLVVFLVRHAEKIDQSRDPDLSEEGYERAAALARILADAELEFVHSSDYLRTRNTAAAVSELFGLEIELYNPLDLIALAGKLKTNGGRHLVVGHSNTTPALVEILGGEPGPAIIEETEYDRLYILTLGREGVNTVLLRYGSPCSSLPSNINASSLLVPQTSGSALKSSQTLGLPGWP